MHLKIPCLMCQRWTPKQMNPSKLFLLFISCYSKKKILKSYYFKKITT